ncbi:MAG: Rap1a family protein [Gemmatimonadaceae bacterium]
MKRLAIGLGLLLLCARPALAQDSLVVVHNGMLTGNDYLSYSVSAQRAYVAGIVDGMLLAPLFGAKERSTAWFVDCVQGMTDVEIRAIIGNYLQAHPVLWKNQMHALVYSALFAACRPQK